MLSRASLALALLLTSTSALAVPQTMAHQGRMFDSSGDSLDGAHDVTFSLFDGATGGTALWSETHSSLSFDNGYYFAQLGALTPMSDGSAFDGDLFLEISVDSGAPMARIPVDSVAFARRADVTTDLMGGIVDATEIRVNGTTIVDSSGDLQTGVSWNDISDLPSGLGSASLGQLACSGSGQIALFDGSAWTCAGANTHLHDAADVSTGTMSIDRLPVGGGSSQVAAGDHGHDLVAMGGVPFITADTTWTVGSGGDHATLQDALDALQMSLISPAATVTLQVLDGTYAITAPITVAHPNGDRIHVVGNTGNPNAVTFSVVDSTALNVTDGNKLGRFDGIRLLGNNSAYNGVSISRGAHANLGPNLVVDQFGGHGILVRDGSYLRAPSITVTNSGSRGIYALYGSFLHLSGATISDSGSSGVEVAFTSTLEGAGLTVNDNYGHGVVTHGGSSAYVGTSTGSGNRFATFQANWNSYTDANNTTSAATTEGPGIGASYSSALLGSVATITDSAHAGVNISWGSAAQLNTATVERSGHAGLNANWGSDVSMTSATITDAGHAGANANWNSTAYLHQAVVTDAGHSGINANWDSAIQAYQAQVTGSGHAGLTPNWGSVMYAQEATATGSGQTGLSSSWESLLHAYRSTSTGNAGNGLYTGPNSSSYAAESNLSNNTSSGATGDWASYFDLNSATVTGNGAHGIGSAWNSVVHAPSSNTSNNGQHGQYAAHGGILYSNSSTSQGNGSNGQAVWDGGYIHSSGSSVQNTNYGVNSDEVDSYGSLIRQ